MAVPAYLRQASKAEYITLATRLAAWTLKWCKDERLFTRRERWIVTGDLWTAAKGVLTCAKQANTRRDLADPAQFAEREALLRRALDHLTEMKVLLSIKYEMMLRGFNAVKQPSPRSKRRSSPPPRRTSASAAAAARSCHRTTSTASLKFSSTWPCVKKVSLKG